MNIRSRFLVAASVMAVLGFASAVSAQESNLYASVGVGSTSVSTDNMGPLSPSGTVLDIRIGDVLYNNDFKVSVEAGGTVGNAEASRSIPTCDIPNCGFNETLNETASTRWAASLGVRVEHMVGDFTVSLSGGLRAADYVQTYHYENDGGFPPSTWTDTSYALGTYWEAGVSYPVGNDWSIGLKYGRSDLTVAKWSSTYGGGERGFTTETTTFEVTKEF